MIVVLCYMLVVCFILVGNEKSHGQSKNNSNSEKSSVESLINKEQTPEKKDAVKKTEELSVAYLPATHDTLLFIAEEEQFFEKYGLSVQIFEYPNSPKAIAALESGKVDIAIPGIATPLYRIAKGGALSIIGGEAWYSAGIVAKRDLKPKGSSLKELFKPFEGKRIATIIGSSGDAILRGKVIEAGLDDEIDIRTYQDPQKVMNALSAGEVDAAMLWSPYMSLVEKKDEQMTVVVWAKHLMKHPCCRQVVLTKTMKKKREALVRYMSGIIKAKDFMFRPENKEKVLDDMKKYIRYIPEDILEKEIFIKDDYLGDGNKRTELSPNNSPKEIKDYVNMMITANLIPHNASSLIEKRVDTDILAEAYQRVYPTLTKEEAAASAKCGLLTHESILKLSPHLGNSGQ